MQTKFKESRDYSEVLAKQAQKKKDKVLQNARQAKRNY
jgi:hypothetical protein